MNMKTIVLTGMMGAGKTSTGKMLAQQLSCEYIDLDTQIENDEKISISEIFERYGEKYFRDKETEAIKKIFTPENMVISLGGGTFENQNIRDFLLRNAVVVYLETSAQTIFNRIKNNTSRPLLKNKMNVETINNIINIRKKNYKLATYCIITDNKTIEDTTLEILKCVGLK